MRAVVLSEFGPPEVLKVAERGRPQPMPGQLLVRVLASGTNPVEAKIRAAGSWAGIQLPAALGYDAAGVVEELGPGALDFKINDPVYFTPEIFGNSHGTHAEYTVVPAAIAARKPTRASFVEAAGVPLAGGTAYEAIVRRLALTVGESVLIHGGAGGVGAFAVQIAKAAGARVFATAGPKNQDYLRELGVDVPIDYTREDFAAVVDKETNRRGVDAAFDTASGELAAKSIPVVRPYGRIATILPPKGDLGGLYMRNQTLHGVFLTRERARLEALTRLIDQGQLKLPIDQVLPLEEVVAAHRRLDSGHGRGKIIFEVAKA